MLLFSHQVMSDSVTPWTAAHQAFLSFIISWSLLKLMSIESGMPSNHLILCFPLLILRSIFPSISVFSSESVLHIRWPKYWCFSFSIGPFNEYLGLISFRINWFDLLAVQGTLKSLQHYSVLWPSNPTAGHTHQGNQNWKRHVYPNVHHSTVYNSQDVEAT